MKKKFTIRDLLNLFIEDKTILTTDVIRKTRKYLFYDGPIPFFVNKELFETVVMYLKDLVQRNDLKNIHDVYLHYENKKSKMKNFIEEFIKKDSGCGNQ